MSSLILALLLAGAADPQQQAAPTLQQLFDTATKAAAEGKCTEAVQAFEQIEQNQKAMSAPTVRAAVDVRKGYCLAMLEHADEGEAAIRRGLPVLAARGADFAEEVRQSHLALARIATLRFDYPAAAAEYRAVLESSTGRDRVRPLLGLAQVLMFDHDGEALRYAAEARALVQGNPAFGKRDVAAVQTQYARALLNAGRVKEGYAELKDSLRKQGGLDLKVDVSDLSTRSDLAIAAWLDHDIDSARNYLAYTGAGRFKDSPFTRARDMDLPPCGEAYGLKPEDSAIIEFSLAEDGHVSGVLPIYVPAGRTAAVAFGRMVSGWSWTPEAAQSIPPLFRSTTRVELRCTTGIERPPLTAPLKQAFADWLETQHVADAGWAAMPAAKAAPLERAALAEARAKGDRAAMLFVLLALGDNGTVSQPDRKAALAEAVTLGDALSAPAAARAYLAITEASVSHEYGSQDAALRALLARPDFQNDPLSAATLRVMIAMPRFRRRAPADGDALLAGVTEGNALPDRHPLKVAALLQRANIAAGKGDVAAAQQYFAKTGLTSRQCSLLGLKPAVRGVGNVDSAFPMAAQQMGFEGWVKIEFDVATDGRTIAPRIVSAYPAFVFDEAGVGMAKSFRYTTSYRPEDGVACTAESTPVMFRLSH
ncbi:energy transducer TonB [uncultured Sphingomonas sp.]|uniref:energy transducer TonB n=1 Tax=uncultured Sphingomonas sp. TaxID=158754 RepID=UPI0025D5E09D|nr:energy transducer TonB [uncultured Sphingomonas sp.]